MNKAKCDDKKLVMLTLGGWWQEDPQCPLANQMSLFGELLASESLIKQKQKTQGG